MKRNNLYIVGLLLLFWVILDYSYRKSITHFFEYDGFSLNNDTSSFLVFLVFYFASLLQILRAKTILQYQITVISIMLVFIPNGIMYYSFHHNFGILISAFLWIFLPLCFPASTSKKKLLPDVNYYKLPQILLLVSLILTLPFLFIYGIPTSLNSLLLQDIYEVRDVANEKANVFTSYVSSPLAKVLIPTTIILSIMSKRWFLLTIAVILQLYFFLINPHKSVLAFLIIALFFSLFRSPKKQLSFFIMGMSVIVFLGTYFMVYHNFPFIESYMSRRSFFIPALLNHSYFEVFADDKIYMSYSKINPIMDYPHDLNPSAYVGMVYFGKEVGANTGLIGSGYMDFGYFGILLNLLIYSKIVAYLANEHYNYRFIGLILILIITFSSSLLTTSLFTHGMLLLVIILNEVKLDEKVKFV